MTVCALRDELRMDMAPYAWSLTTVIYSYFHKCWIEITKGWVHGISVVGLGPIALVNFPLGGGCASLLRDPGAPRMHPGVPSGHAGGPRRHPGGPRRHPRGARRHPGGPSRHPGGTKGRSGDPKKHPRGAQDVPGGTQEVVAGIRDTV